MHGNIWLGFDPREAAAFAVARHGIKRRLTQPIPVHGLVLADLQALGVYTRPLEWRTGQDGRQRMWDVVSQAPMATEFACSRFAVCALAKRRGWALFMDCDMLVRTNLARLFEDLNPAKAVYCVKHDYHPANATKMDGQVQQAYNRKLWASFVVFNAEHPSNEALTHDYINTTPGRDLHAFSWLQDDEIGELGQEWNWIPGHSPPEIDPKIVHFTEGGPWFEGYEDVPYADEWRAELRRWAGG